jgi:hypothetical protein
MESAIENLYKTVGNQYENVSFLLVIILLLANAQEKSVNIWKLNMRAVVDFSGHEGAEI